MNDDIGPLFPNALTCNLRHSYQEADYKTETSVYTDPLERRSALRQASGVEKITFQCGSWVNIRKLEICDNDGTYTKLQRVTHRLIDATCLRVCKSFYAICCDMIYKQNAFAFDDASNWKNATGDQYPLEIRSLMID